jgi:hypothetical protein
MNILLFVVLTAISIAAVSVHRLAVISMIDPDRVTVGNHNNDSILFLTILLILSVVLSVKNKGSMRKRKLFEKYLEEDKLSSLPLFAHWKPNPPVGQDVLQSAQDWCEWRRNSPWYNVFNSGEPDVTGWNLYITHLYELADALGLSFSELIRLDHSSVQNIAQSKVNTHLHEAVNAFLRRSLWIVNGEYKRLKQIVIVTQRFRMLEQVTLYETYDEFVGRYVYPNTVRA